MTKIKALVVDDEIDVLDLCKRILETQRYEVKSVNSGEEALKIAQNEHFDLLLTDIKMPGIEGLELAYALKQSDPDIICIAMTGFSTMDMAINALRLGVDEFILKPFTPKELSKAVSRALEKKNLHKQIIQLQVQIDDLYRQLVKEREKNKSNVLANQISTPTLSSLTAGIVHDLRGGLGVIHNLAGFMQDVLDPDDALAEDVRKIIYSVEFCGLVIRNLMTLEGDEILNLVEVNLEEVIREVFFILKRKLIHVNLVIEAGPNIPMIVADEGQMKQVFMNLIKNAGEAMPEVGTLTIHMSHEDDWLCVKVSDTGAGISPENLSNIFNLYFTTKKTGYGVGLHIVRAIIERHGGTIEVSSTVGEGTTFILYLPLNY